LTFSAFCVPRSSDDERRTKNDERRTKNGERRNEMSVTTHVLDVARGKPAAGMTVTLDQGLGAKGWVLVGQGETDADGRLRTLMPAGKSLVPGPYRLVFETGRYFGALGISTLYPHITIVFDAAAGEAHYHVPLLLSPFGYTTYRGS
jgi:5-hydroxyisourate hydrolase